MPSPTRSRRLRGNRPSLRSVRRAVESSARIVPRNDILAAIAKSKLKSLVTAMTIGDRHIRIRNWQVLDRELRVCSAEAVQKYLAWSVIDRKKYEAESFDCDDFAASIRGEARRRLKLNSIAEVWDFSGGHAYIAAVVHDGPGTDLRVIAIEPQNDRIIEPGAGQYAATRGMIIF